jgi:hypothetical protein
MECYLCKVRGKMTRDHIPPKSFFPPPPPPNLIVVPCCETCNSSYKLDDDAIRAWFCSPLGASSAGGWIFKNRALPGTIGGSLAFQKKMLASMKNIKASTETGEFEVIQLTVPRDRIERFIVRIVKGLLTHHYPNYDYSIASFNVEFIGQSVDLRKILEPLIDQLTYAEKDKDVFQYRHGLTESGQSGAWILAFYHVAIFFIIHTTNDSDDSALCRPFSNQG